MSEELTKTLTELANKLNIGVDVLWAALIRQATIAAIWNCVWIIGAIIGVIWTFKIEGPFRKPIQCAAVGIGFIIIMLSGYEALYAAFNPEYWALKEILDR